MFEFNIAIIATYSLSLAVILSMIRIRKLDRRFLPFVVLITGGLVNEVVSYYCIRRFGHNMINYNLYCLFEALVLLWLFLEWEVIRKKAFLVMAAAALVSWNIEYFLRGYALVVNSWFVVTYSFVVVILSINAITGLLYEESYRLYKNARFLIASAFLLFFVCSMVLEVFWLFRLMEEKSFQVKLYGIFNFVNLFTNLVLAVAVLCIPSRRRSILELS